MKPHQTLAEGLRDAAGAVCSDMLLRDMLKMEHPGVSLEITVKVSPDVAGGYKVDVSYRPLGEPVNILLRKGLLGSAVSAEDFSALKEVIRGGAAGVPVVPCPACPGDWDEEIDSKTGRTQK